MKVIITAQNLKLFCTLTSLLMKTDKEPFPNSDFYLMSTRYSTWNTEVRRSQTQHFCVQLKCCLVSTREQKAALGVEHYKYLSFRERHFQKYTVWHVWEFLVIFGIPLRFSLLLPTFYVTPRPLSYLFVSIFSLILLCLGKHVAQSPN